MTRQIHVIGAGLAGLAAALELSEQPGLQVTVWERTDRPGGRCWSFEDTRLGRVIDNGNHLILSGNGAVLDHAARIGAADRLEIAPEAALPFADLESGERWVLRVPSGLRDLTRGTGLREGLPRIALDAARLWAAPRTRSVAQAIPRRGGAWRDLWEPLTLAVLNAPPEVASAALLRAVLSRSLARGGAACRPVTAPEGLGHALIEPAVALLQERGVTVRYRAAVTGIEAEGGRAARLCFAREEPVPLGPRDGVILAAPPQVAAALLGLAAVPAPGLSILNAHFRVAPDLAALAAPVTGVIGGAAQWIFRRGDVLSVTVSAEEATPVAGMTREAALARLWQDVARTLGRLEAGYIAARLLRERAATFHTAPEDDAARLPMRSPLANLLHAGDHVRGPLPSTLEAAVLSGRAAGAAMLEAGGA
ncbi:hydroxysqualene dehydroxylase HpnE [Pseudoroseicyclus aestuarii]|uniref:Squalene-associated FAD-dependent desaturase n=1 Tax=Pseudoroseicyclus aestuarii TaxID=1795041 RepID=A0A318SRY5_9RHOB|nr:hydroxysqualene dehydroxylase HpnE [Pseudoroseicyclus aestuarii]PYE80889.1 squalene-associated FAD-dependent desaturase [Pseudoroseicyclus aestuarii]